MGKEIKIPYGNGQEIYIDAEALYIPSEWINQEQKAIIMPNRPSNESNPVYEAYKKMFQYLYAMDYKIITDSRFVNENTFFFSPCLDKHVNKTREEYHDKKSKKINLCLIATRITPPFTVEFPADTFPKILPAFPFVLKNQYEQGGVEKFFIKNENQLQILKKFYKEINLYDREKRIEKLKKEYYYYPDLEFDENGKSNHVISVNLINYQKEFHENMALQEYIKTPTKYNTSLRVLTSSSGDILAASLKYADDTSKTEEDYYGFFDRYLSNQASPYFLGSGSIISNTVAGGSSILLGRNDYYELEQEILIAHGINPNHATVPTKVRKASLAIAMQCAHEIGAICGLDFIYNEEQKSWKYLEEHEGPMLYSYAEKYHLPYSYEAEDFYTTHQLLDMEIRLHALVLTMQKKQSLVSNLGKKK